MLDLNQPVTPWSYYIDPATGAGVANFNGEIWNNGAPFSPGGIILLKSGEIKPADNDEFLLLDLPLGYKSFELKIDDFQMAVNSSDRSLNFALSADGGSTWINNTVDFDSYRATQAIWSPNLQNTVAVNDSLGYLFPQPISDGNDSPLTGAWSLSIIDPGTDGNYPTIYTDAYWSAGSPDSIYFSKIYARCKTAGRVNKMIIMPYGMGDAPPSSGYKLTHVYYSLWGLPE